MGNFFTSTQIYNSESITREQFIDKFCKKMADEGYVTCNSDESELSYILRFADNCKWVTITSEAYESGNALSHKDTGRIAKMLGTTCVNTVVIDSDCAILELYDKNGKKADMFTIGRADDYFGDDIPQPSEKVWKPFLCNGSTWEQFAEICSSEEVFVEDSLSELAPVIGMDSGNILFSADDAEEDENTITLGFAKAVVKKEKKLSLNAAFKSVYGWYLEPYGFKLLKSKYPYFVRIINSEIIQTISITKERSFMNNEGEGFSLCIGLSLTCQNLTNFDKNPMTIENQGYYTCDLRRLYHNYSLSFDVDKYAIKQFSFFYKKGDNEEMLSAMNESQQKLMPFVLEFFDMTKNIDGIYHIGRKMLLGCFNDAILLTQNVDEFLAQREKVFPEELKRIVDSLERNPFMRPLAEKKKAEAIEKNNSFIQWFIDRKVGGAAYEDYMKQVNETKNENLDFFQKYL